MGCLVSLKVEPLEPMQDGLGRLIMLQPKFVRGRFGCLPLLPQLEEAVGGLPVGGSAFVRVMYPGHFPLPWLQRQTRLFKVTLLDAKRYGFAPIIDRELLVGGSSGRFQDSTTLTDTQLHAVKETAVLT